MKIINPSIEILTETTYSSMLNRLERIGRVCYKSEDKIKVDSAEGFIRGIIKRGHESVIEHESISVKVVCDRGVSHEIVRHRIASYSQESTRYCNYSEGKFDGHITVIDPITGFGWNLDDPQDEDKHRIWMSAMLDADRHYLDMIKAGATPQEARSVLPNSLKTELVMTMNLREWRHFIRLRDNLKAHPQAQEVAHKIGVEFAKRYPVFFEDLEGSDGNA